MKIMPLKLKITTQSKYIVHPYSMVILFSHSILSFLLFSRLVLVEASLVATHLLVTHIGPCENVVPVIVTVKEFTITTHNYDSMISGEFNVTADITNGWTVKATMQKCQDIRNIDTCDHFRSFWVVRAGCTSSERVQTTLFNHTAPEISCPIRAGTYQLHDYPILTADNSLTVHESKISTSVFGYSLILEGSTVDRRELFCVEAYLQLLYLRQHNWLGNKRKNQTIPPLTTTPRDEDDDE